MTANKDLKKLIRKRMHKTGESYTAARRHFLAIEDASMTKPHATTQPNELNLSIDRLQLTLKTARALQQQDIRTIEQLIQKSDRDWADLGLTSQARTEIRDVLASRGL